MDAGKCRITGDTIKRDGSPAPRQKLMAYNVSLSGAAKYKTITSLEALDDNSANALLAEADSGRDGRYAIEFNRYDIANVRRRQLNIVVFAVADKEILGRSTLVSVSDDGSEAHDVDVVITRSVDTRPEYLKITSVLDTYLKQNNVSLKEIASSRDQVSYVSYALEDDQLKIGAAAQAESLREGQPETLSHELLYGIGRQGLSLTWAYLYHKKDSELRDAIQKAIDDEIIGPQDEQTIALFLEETHKQAAQWILDYQPDQRESLDKVLSYASLNREQRLAFVSAARSFDGDYTDFWKSHLPEDPAFKNQPELVQALLLTQQLSMLTENHAPLIEELQAERKISHITDLLELNDEQWETILQATGTPFIEEDDEDQKIKRYWEARR